jgi:hypothetical protein
MPSIMTEEISFPCSSKHFCSAVSSLNGRKITFSVSLTGAMIAGLSVTATASEVLP